MPVKPLTVVTKVGTWLPRRGVNMGLGDDGEQFIHEDCVTLADAERYAREKTVEALHAEREFNGRPMNHGAFYLETQADLVLRQRVDELEKRVKELERNDLV